MSVDKYTWDQAEIIGAWSPDAFKAVGLNPANVRKWASRGRIRAIGSGPNGCKLYNYDAVVQYADSLNAEVVAQPVQGCHTVSAPKTTLSSDKRSA